MKGLVAYSKPRGKYGVDFIFTVVIEFNESHEEVTIQVSRPTTVRQHVYSCHSCGHFGTVRVSTENVNMNPNETSVQGSLHFYRYDGVQANDQIYIGFIDRGLVFSQATYISIGHLEVRARSDVGGPEEVVRQLPKPVYPVTVLNWDKRMRSQKSKSERVRVEEELITSVMNNQPIAIKELLLKPASQPQLQSGLHFIEGELKYLD